MQTKKSNLVASFKLMKENVYHVAQSQTNQGGYIIIGGVGDLPGYGDKNSLKCVKF